LGPGFSYPVRIREILILKHPEVRELGLLTLLYAETISLISFKSSIPREGFTLPGKWIINPLPSSLLKEEGIYLNRQSKKVKMKKYISWFLFIIKL